MSIRGEHGPKRPLLAPIYVNVSELNNRSSWENHSEKRGESVGKGEKYDGKLENILWETQKLQ